MIDDDDREKKPSKKGANALEKFLNIEPTEMEKIEYEDKPLVKHEEYDSKDKELEEQIQEVYKRAMSGYLSLEAILEGTEPKYRARLAEVALAYLNTGLNAINSKAKQKEHKDKLSVKEKAPSGQTTNYVFTGDRNDAIKMARKMKEQEEPIDAEVIQKDESDSN